MVRRGAELAAEGTAPIPDDAVRVAALQNGTGDPLFGLGVR